jgi:YVTN family beta-propeller protein
LRWAIGLALGMAAFAWAQGPATPAKSGPTAIAPVPGMPPVVDPANLYSETTAGKLSAVVAADLPRVYVPNLQSNDVYVIDPATFAVVDKFKVGLNPQHVVPSYDLRTLWVANNAENTKRGSLTPVDPKTGKPGKAIAVDDPYNMYFSPDGKSAIVVAEAMRRLDFRDPQTMQLQYSIDVPRCAGINHADFSIDGTFAIFTCEFTGTVAKIDLVQRKVLGYTQTIQPGKPTRIVKGPGWQGRGHLHDVERDAAGHSRLAGRQDLLRGRHDGRRCARRRRRDVPADRLHRDRQGHARPLSQPRRQEALRRQSRLEQDPRRRPRQGQRVRHRFRDAQGRGELADSGGGSPDMGNVSADGKMLWLSGRYDNVVYAIDTGSGAVKIIPSDASRTGSRSGRSPDGTRSGTRATCARVPRHAAGGFRSGFKAHRLSFRGATATRPLSRPSMCLKADCRLRS